MTCPRGRVSILRRTQVFFQSSLSFFRQITLENWNEFYVQMHAESCHLWNYYLKWCFHTDSEAWYTPRLLHSTRVREEISTSHLEKWLDSNTIYLIIVIEYGGAHCGVPPRPPNSELKHTHYPPGSKGSGWQLWAESPSGNCPRPMNVALLKVVPHYRDNQWLRNEQQQPCSIAFRGKDSEGVIPALKSSKVSYLAFVVTVSHVNSSSLSRPYCLHSPTGVTHETTPSPIKVTWWTPI